MTTEPKLKNNGFLKYLLSENRTVLLLTTGMILSWIIFVVYSAIQGGAYYRIMFFKAGEDSFMDFFNSCRDAAQGYGVYTERHVIYPPLANFFYVFFNIFISKDYLNSYLDERYMYALHPFNFMVYMVSTAFVLAALAMLFSFIVEGNHKKKTLLTFIFLFNWPVIFTIERGNIFLLVFLLVMIFVFFYDSDNKVISELSCICLAVAAGLKLYPALFGIFLVLSKKYKQAIRTVIYGIAAFVLPFGAYHWVEGFKVWVKNIIRFSNKHSVADNYSGITSVKTIIYFMMDKLFGKHGFTGAVDKIFSALIIIALVAAILLLKEKYQKFIALFVLVDALPGAGGGYTFMFLLIPLVYIVNTKKIRPYDYLYVLVILSELMPYPIPLRFVKGYTSVNYGIEGLAVLVIFILIMCDLVYMLVKKFAPKMKKIKTPKVAATILIAVLAIGVFGGLMESPVRADVAEDFTPVQMMFDDGKYTVRRTPDELIPEGFTRGEVMYYRTTIPALVRPIGSGARFGYIYVLDLDNGNGYDFYVFDIEKEVLKSYTSFTFDGVTYTVIDANLQSFSSNMVGYDTNVTLINGKKHAGAVYRGKDPIDVNLKQLICLVGPDNEVGYYTFTAVDGNVASVHLYGTVELYPTPCPSNIGNHTLARKLQYSAEKLTVICMAALFIPTILIVLGISFGQYKVGKKKGSNK